MRTGVAIFFVISGALLYLPYARAIRDRRTLPEWREYARRRAVRILPAYWVALTVFGLGPFHVAVFGANAWRYYGLSQIDRPDTVLGGLGPAWSLCVELSFYALLPLFAWLGSWLSQGAGERRAARVQLALIAAAGVASAGLRWVVAGSLTAPVPDGAKTVMVALPGLLDWFAIGMALAVLRAELEAGRAARTLPALLGRRPAWCVLLALASFLAAVPGQRGDLFLPWYGLATHVLIGAGAGLMVLAVVIPRPAGPAPWSLRLLAHPLSAWVGTVSYGVYLWHLQVLMLVEPHLLAAPASGTIADALLGLVIAVAGGVALGAASRYLVERPIQRRFASRRGRNDARRTPGHRPKIDVPVQSTLHALNSSGVPVDHLA